MVNNIKEDKQLMNYVNEMKKISASNNNNKMLHDYGRIYNDASNYLVLTYQIDGNKALDIIDELLTNK